MVRFKELPRALRNALQYLATASQIDTLSESLKEQLARADPKLAPESGDASCDPELLQEPASIAVVWREGVEEYQNFSKDQLWEKLGLPDKKIPFFNDRYDPQGIHDAWTDEGSAWLSGNGKQLEPYWYQLVGVHKMIENAFLGKPALLMDEVGLGKTLQVAAFTAIMTYYREHYEAHQSFPGDFKSRTSAFSINLYATSCHWQ